MIHALAFMATMTFCLTIALRHGGRDERIAAIAAAIGTVATFAVGESHQYFRPEWQILAIDIGVLAAFWGVSMITRSFWPYWITAWQLLTVSVHLERAAFPGIVPEIYAFFAMKLSYPIVALIISASLRARRVGYEL